MSKILAFSVLASAELHTRKLPDGTTVDSSEEKRLARTPIVELDAEKMELDRTLSPSEYGLMRADSLDLKDPKKLLSLRSTIDVEKAQRGIVPGVPTPVPDSIFEAAESLDQDVHRTNAKFVTLKGESTLAQGIDRFFKEDNGDVVVVQLERTNCLKSLMAWCQSTDQILYFNQLPRKGMVALVADVRKADIEDDNPDPSGLILAIDGIQDMLSVF